MFADNIVDLSECTEFRQTLAVRPPRIVHGTLLLSLVFMGIALVWAYVSKVDVVVKAPGRVRPLNAPTVGFDTVSGERIFAPVTERVSEVCCREGDTVQKGDVLVQLDTERLDNDIAGLSRSIRAAQDELGKLQSLRERLAKQFTAAREKAEAELAEAEDGFQRAQARRHAEIKLVELELERAAEEEQRFRELAERQAASSLELKNAVTARREAEARLQRARLSVAPGRIAVWRSELTLLEEQFARENEELEIRIATKSGDLESASTQLKNLRLQHKQSALRAGTGGVLTSLQVCPGDLVQVGQVVATIAQPQELRMDVFVSSKDIGRLRVGMPARVKLDAFDYQECGTLSGRIDFISPDASAQPQGALGYMVRIAFESDELRKGQVRARVKMGMTGVAEMIGQERRLLTLALRKFRDKFSPFEAKASSKPPNAPG